jgi:hypothetical protein
MPAARLDHQAHAALNFLIRQLVPLAEILDAFERRIGGQQNRAELQLTAAVQVARQHESRHVELALGNALQAVLFDITVFPVPAVVRVPRHDREKFRAGEIAQGRLGAGKLARSQQQRQQAQDVENAGIKHNGVQKLSPIRAQRQRAKRVRHPRQLFDCRIGLRERRQGVWTVGHVTPCAPLCLAQDRRARSAAPCR